MKPRGPAMGAIVLALSTIEPTAALANMVAARPNASPFTGPVVLSTPCEILSEDLEIICRAENGAPRCRFTATYIVHNPTQERQTVVAAFYGERTSGVFVELDGAAVSPEGHHLEELRALAVDTWRPQGEIREFGFKIQLRSEQSARLVARGVIEPGEQSPPTGPWWTSHELRHPLLGGELATGRYDLRYLISPIRSWARVGPIRVVFRYPSHWKSPTLEAIRNTESGQEVVDPDWRFQELEHQVQATATIGKGIDKLEFTFDAPIRFALVHGGPFAGATRSDRGWGMRLGYEIAESNGIIGAVAMDTDFKERIVVTPSVDLATPALLLVPIPSLSVGLGLPVELRPALHMGIRIQTGVYGPHTGFVLAWDLYPDGNRNNELSLTLRVGI